MKAVKIIVITISIFVVVFLSIGFLMPETKYNTQVEIEKPVEVVFAAFNNSAELKNWIPEFKSIETIEEKLGKKGSRYKLLIENQGQEIAMEQKVIDFVPNEKVTLFYNTGAGNMLKTDGYTFKRKGNSTVILHTATCRSSGYLMACMLPIFQSKLKSQDKTYLSNFKTFIEKK